jgi:hypothetical protein
MPVYATNYLMFNRLCHPQTLYPARKNSTFFLQLLGKPQPATEVPEEEGQFNIARQSFLVEQILIGQGLYLAKAEGKANTATIRLPNLFVRI